MWTYTVFFICALLRICADIVGDVGRLVGWSCCSNMAGWIEFLLGTVAGLAQCLVVLSPVHIRRLNWTELKFSVPFRYYACWLSKFDFYASTRPEALCSQIDRLSVSLSVTWLLNMIFWLKTNEPILMKVDTSGPAGSGMKC